MAGCIFGKGYGWTILHRIRSERESGERKREVYLFIIPADLTCFDAFYFLFICYVVRFVSLKRVVISPIGLIWQLNLSLLDLNLDTRIFIRMRYHGYRDKYALRQVWSKPICYQYPPFSTAITAILLNTSQTTKLAIMVVIRFNYNLSWGITLAMDSH